MDASQALHRMIYVSQASPETAARFDAAVDEIITRSQANNAAVDVTGLLLAAGGWFVQALEGPRGAVSTTFGRIGRDARHGAVEILQSGPVDGRLFARWSMVARTLSPQAAPLMEAMAGAGAFEPKVLDAASALRLLLTVSDLAEGRLKQAG
jgi:hypothetical protein